MRTDRTTKHYPLAMRASVLNGLAIGSFGLVGIYMGFRMAYIEYTTYRSLLVSIGDLFTFLPVGCLLSGIFLSSVRIQWFVLCGYTLDASDLVVVSPVLRTRRYVELSSVTRIETFNMYVLPRPNGGRDSLGRALYSSDGAIVRLSTDFVMWPEVEKLCVNAKAAT